jgi:hypothetical protein
MWKRNKTEERDGGRVLSLRLSNTALVIEMVRTHARPKLCSLQYTTWAVRHQPTTAQQVTLQLSDGLQHWATDHRSD